MVHVDARNITLPVAFNIGDWFKGFVYQELCLPPKKKVLPLESSLSVCMSASLARMSAKPTLSPKTRKSKFLTWAHPWHA